MLKGLHGKCVVSIGDSHKLLASLAPRYFLYKYCEADCFTLGNKMFHLNHQIVFSELSLGFIDLLHLELRLLTSDGLWARL